VWTELLEWVARLEDSKEPATQISLFKRTALLPPPGKGAAKKQPLTETQLFTSVPSARPPAEPVP
jgi:hypothetical protein